MEQVVSITSQGQITIPKEIRDVFGIHSAVKAFVRIKDNTIIVEPKKDFWSLPGSLHSKIKLSDEELKKARATFSRKWARKI